ncbi:hypothetical protein QBC47DRAFT_357197 [Echria macrotheca]|uniref:CCCH zinc finger and RRM domain-containing protein n=1 Tax=Echria macrotheca TaxID=438768 RepID=A0AAJ0F9Q5_9PEZI|nr:hypothetical protein QBC47DRAFT_357197 [Echria macrotheca]
MLFPEEDAGHLKAWIVKRIENNSVADADVLADYVLALLGHDGSVEDVRKLCELEVPDFLKEGEDPAKFVNDVFEAIEHKAYLPGAQPPPSSRPAAAFAHGFLKGSTAPYNPPPAAGLSYDDMPSTETPHFTGTLGWSLPGSKKRGWDGDSQQQQGQLHGEDGKFGSQNSKRAKLNGRARGPDGLPLQPGFANAEMLQFAPGQHGINPLMMFPVHPMHLGRNPFPQMPPQGRKRQRCRDFDTKGYCSRGATCPFQHGDDPVFPPTFGQPALLPGHDEYDPSNALLGGGLFAMSNLMAAQRPPLGRNQGKKGKRKPKAPFSADGPVFDKTKTTIVVEGIPEENFTEEQVREYFSTFGNITEVSMQPYKRLAIVKYDNWGSANAAYRSPKAVFDNRFVKVFWYKDDESSLPQSVPTEGTKTLSVSGSGDANSPAPISEAEMKEIMKRQEEAQRLHEEKMQKLKEIEHQREELEKKQKELLTKHQEEKAKLEAKLAEKNGGVAPSEEKDKTSKPMSQSEALRAQLAALEEEAKQLGIDPDAASEAGWSASGGFGGSRGYHRGRGYAPRGRASFRGRGNHHAAYAMYSLDNRPKKVVITGVDFTVPEKDEVLRQHLFGVGEFTDITATPESTEVTFKDRKTAEKFFYGIHMHNKTIPGVEGQIEPSWAGGGSTSSTPTPSTAGSMSAYFKAQSAFSKPPHRRNGSLDGGNGDGHGSVTSDKDVQITLDRPPGQDDMDYDDYDVADSNQWDIE